ncbi:hypothetical protein A3H16_00475 [Candidatus Kaiserbacteria bacterium RIFCSPLOWO2_12_FULL_53_8]|uniref:Uncharacterized protein n=2 Tax=Candidatus Kaiseribacteriota TaxID=1752734 RepID=A0A1F6CY01_9BACT|nr:MAG: hypothetical protein A2851_03385 [Candidatus Kaiserbacteria bacterium RIFCSPHIGHO2_01_FULL_53_29]OGG92119.1 MAG: hypothetical protein A3H16_00475 [Candidatus Kaiserbacteria bacterium RIFCSPLOWO2_12_FULL_53_8]
MECFRDTSAYSRPETAQEYLVMYNAGNQQPSSSKYDGEPPKPMPLTARERRERWAIIAFVTAFVIGVYVLAFGW